MSGTIYRGWVRTRAIGTDNMMPPSFRVEVKRMSVGATAAAVQQLVLLMLSHLPHRGLSERRAEATLEVSRPREGCHQLARYSGVPTHVRPSNVVSPCGVCGGQWSLEWRESGVLAPLTLAVGGPYTGPRTCGGCARLHFHDVPYVCTLPGGCPCIGCVEVELDTTTGSTTKRYTKWIERLP